MKPNIPIPETIERILSTIGAERENLIPILQEIQKEFRYLPDDALEYLASVTKITPADITGVATFYSQFRSQPVGKHLISVCTGTACHVKGADRIFNAFKQHLGIIGDNDTSPDSSYTVHRVGCLGCCMLAPAVRIDETTYGHLTTDNIDKVITDFETIKHHKKNLYNHVFPKTNSGEIRICTCSSCAASGADDVHYALIDTVRRYKLDISIKQVGCNGISAFSPSITVIKKTGASQQYKCLTEEDAREILLSHFPPKGIRKIINCAEKLVDNLITNETFNAPKRCIVEETNPDAHAFMNHQRRIATKYLWEFDPLSITDYRKYGGFKALEESIKSNTPEKLLDIIRNSKLRGRGGGGFPTAVKMEAVRKASGAIKSVVCNGDEGDPGAFMDRMLLESCPYRVIEGIALAAFITDASQGILYIRAEYPLAVQRMRQAIVNCNNTGLLGTSISGTSFSFDLKVMEGAGAFVCGEETALLASIEGRRGMPSYRPPYPSESGWRGTPTLINNVETCTLIPWIIQNGAEAFSAIGTTSSSGTKVFSLAGKVLRGGLIEVPMGTTIRTIVEDIGGGIPDNGNTKAVQIGGPSGGCIPYSLADTPVDYEALTDKGVIMGSGGIVVLDEHDCMVDIARYFLEFTQSESCGRCAPCRVGTKRMLEILQALCRGEATPHDLERLEYLSGMVSKTSLCGLGQTAPNPVLSTLKYFRDEYEAHLNGYCPAGSCTALINYHITDKCIGCTLCAQHCPVEAIEFTPYQIHEIDKSKCTRCGNCRDVCPELAVEIISPCHK